jgi:hypothetical protein
LPAADLSFIAVSPAEAKAFYTKKRVNGRWISGYFPKRGTVAQKDFNERMPDAETPGIKVAAASAPAVTSIAVTSLQRAEALPASPALQATLPAGNGPLVPAPEQARLNELRQALQARASALTNENAAGQGPKPAPEAQAVSLDFKSGIKTTVFSDGTAVREPFDVAALKGLAAVPPEAPLAK